MDDGSEPDSSGTKCSERCCKHLPPAGVSQSLDELDFERGLWSAALDGELERLQRLLRDGRDPNAPDSAGYSPLHYAARSGHLAVCEALIAARACVNATTRSGSVTPLQRAAYCGHTAVVKLLLRHGARPLDKDADNRTALHKACERGRVDVARLLLEHGACAAHIRDISHKTPIDYVKPEQTELRKFLMESEENSKP